MEGDGDELFLIGIFPSIWLTTHHNPNWISNIVCVIRRCFCPIHMHLHRHTLCHFSCCCCCSPFHPQSSNELMMMLWKPLQFTHSLASFFTHPHLPHSLSRTGLSIYQLVYKFIYIPNSTLKWMEIKSIQRIRSFGHSLRLPFPPLLLRLHLTRAITIYSRYGDRIRSQWPTRVYGDQKEKGAIIV